MCHTALLQVGTVVSGHFTVERNVGLIGRETATLIFGNVMLVTQIQNNKTWLKDSWRRSVQAGLSSRKQPDDRRIDGEEIKSRAEQYQSLIQVVEQHAYPLFCQIFSRTDSV